MTSWQALKMALIGATIIVLTEGSSMAATITVHAPDGAGLKTGEDGMPNVLTVLRRNSAALSGSGSLRELQCVQHSS
jgi:hypothetical protein